MQGCMEVLPQFVGSGQGRTVWSLERQKRIKHVGHGAVRRPCKSVFGVLTAALAASKRPCIQEDL